MLACTSQVVQLSSGVATGVQLAGQAGLEKGQISQANRPIQIDDLIGEAAVSRYVQCLAVHRQPRQRDVLSAHCGCHIDASVLADQRRNWRHAAGYADSSFDLCGRRPVLHRRGNIQFRFAL